MLGIQRNLYTHRQPGCAATEGKRRDSEVALAEGGSLFVHILYLSVPSKAVEAAASPILGAVGPWNGTKSTVCQLHLSNGTLWPLTSL